MPGPIQAKRIRAGASFVLHIEGGFEVASAGILVPGVKELQADREEVVVHEAGEDGKEAQACDHVAGGEERRLCEAESLRILAEPKSGQEEKDAMPHVAVHHAEDEGEGHDRQQGRVCLLVLRNAIGINHILPDLRVVVDPDVRGRRRLDILVRRQECSLRRASVQFLQQGLDLGLFCGRVPHVDPQGDLARAQVQDVEDGLLLDAEQPPFFQLRVGLRVLTWRRQQVRSLGLHEELVAFQSRVLFLDHAEQMRMARLGQFGTGWPVVHVHTKSGAHLEDLLLHRATGSLKVDDKD
mmetsp:Transcript_9915/g.18432  ORF Transcript_9915/g.18432 Transcript_9915/m.18432 type:complete len:296 (-) Transcript_9915:101-988(-)